MLPDPTGHQVCFLSGPAVIPGTAQVELPGQHPGPKPEGQLLSVLVKVWPGPPSFPFLCPAAPTEPLRLGKSSGAILQSPTSCSTAVLSAGPEAP